MTRNGLIRLVRALALALVLAAGSFAAVRAQDSLDVTFRYLPDLTGTSPALVRAYLPGNFNDWGPNASGRIAVDAPSLMTYDADQNEYRYRIRLHTGSTYTYKVHYHVNAAGSEYVWISDPLNDRVTGPNNDSVLELRDPMLFQLARRQDASGQIVEVSATLLASRTIDSLGFEINGVPRDGLALLDADTGIFRYELAEPVPTGSQFRIGARDAEGNRAFAEVGLIPPVVVDAPRPVGVEDGINFHGDGSSVTLSLFAPFKGFVHVIGDFNDWEVDEEYLMIRDAVREDSVHWWITLDGLQPGEAYGFQYLVDGQLRIADPFSAMVLDPAHDSFISSAIYPNLKPYPAGQTSEIVSVIKPIDQLGRPAVEFERPPQHELVIYELLIRDFLQNATYETLRDTLGYLVRLGINAVELMPVSQFDGNLSWGYNPTFHAAVEKAYGPIESLMAFIDAAHAEGLAVIVDAVYNHAHDRSSLVRLYGASAENPYLNIPASHPYNVFYQLNHDHPYIHYYIDRANEFWLEEMWVDGFRFDLTKGFMTSGSVDGHNPQRIRNLKRMADALWEVDPEAYVILEHFAADSEERELASYRVEEGLPGMMLWNNVNHAYNEATMGWLSQSNFSRAYFGPGGRNWPLPHLVSYMESHDEQWLMLKNRRFGNSGPGYDVRELPEALDRMKLAGAFFFTLPGPRMMWQFGELGYGGGPRECLKPGGSGSGDCPASDPGRTDQKPIRWEYFEDPLRQKLYRTWSELLRLRREHAVFRDPETDVSLVLADAVKHVTLQHEEMAVVVVGNFDVAAQDTTLDFPSSGTWYDFFEGVEVQIGEAPYSLSLLPGEFHLYTSEFVEPAEPDLITVDAETTSDEPFAFALDQNYPNPFNPSTEIAFTVTAAGPVRLEVFDVLGRLVALLVDGVVQAGRHTVRFESNGLPSGPYAYRLTTSDHALVRTMILLR